MKLSAIKDAIHASMIGALGIVDGVFVVDGRDVLHKINYSFNNLEGKKLKNVYERAVNIGQVTRLVYEVYKTAGRVDHFSIMQDLDLDKIRSIKEISRIVKNNYYKRLLQN
jgi:hypothetical protein